MPKLHGESHRSQRSGWLRAAVLGANDGIISLSCLVMGMAAGNTASDTIGLAAVAGVLAGALSMAAGEYVSVASQADMENADMAREAQELRDEPERELLELKAIYKSRGLSPKLALEVATAFTRHDALKTHLRDELGIIDSQLAKPLQAACASAASFALGALMPCLCIFFAAAESLLIVTPVVSLLSLYLLGIIAAKIGGAPVFVAANRVFIWGLLAMGITSGAGYWFGSI